MAPLTTHYVFFCSCPLALSVTSSCLHRLYIVISYPFYTSLPLFSFTVYASVACLATDFPFTSSSMVKKIIPVVPVYFTCLHLQ